MEESRKKPEGGNRGSGCHYCIGCFPRSIEYPAKGDLNGRDFPSHLTKQEAWRKVEWLQNQLFQWLKDIFRDLGIITFLHSGPQLVCQVSCDPRPKVAAVVPSVSCEPNDSWEEQGPFLLHAFFY